ncbi:transposase [Chloracidobacterium thermophilum]|uniref:transposase n=1 Tax=Chloracidobacterium thermophilum TaxID=458033 RepID=UPI000B0E5D66|nr:transposase [Chloracidobacterium thermophilum]
MKYDPERHHRRSIRLRGYDYSQAGAYFVTICTRNRACLFGEVVDGTVQLNPLGEIVQQTWHNLPNHVAGIRLDTFVVMPNHVHGIIMIDDDTGAKTMGADGVVGTDGVGAHGGVGAGSEPAPTHQPAPTIEPTPTHQPTPTTETKNPTATLTSTITPATETAPIIEATTPGPAAMSAVRLKRQGLPEIIRQFKTFSARRINEHQGTPGIAIWQRNYYEHIIRNREALHRIRQYVLDNPRRWASDRENPAASRPNQPPGCHGLMTNTSISLSAAVPAPERPEYPLSAIRAGAGIPSMTGRR